MTQAAILAASASLGTTTGFKNRIINGAMVIDQRNAGASVTPTSGVCTLDRWYPSLTQASKYTVQQNAGSVTPPAGFTNYLGITSSSAYSVGATDFFLIGQNIEGYNIADLGWGTANAKTITISFWVRSSLTGTFSGAINNSAYDRSYVFSYTISAANTWEQKSVTITGDIAGTWLTTNGLGLRMYLCLGSGSTYTASANSWQAGTYVGVTGTTSVVGTNGATFYLTGVQLEVGTQATTFDYRSYGTELALCQRYYQKYNQYALSTGFRWSSTAVWTTFYNPVQFRTTPTATGGANIYRIDNSQSDNAATINSVDTSSANTPACMVIWNVAFTPTSNYTFTCFLTSAGLALSAEL